MTQTPLVILCQHPDPINEAFDDCQDQVFVHLLAAPRDVRDNEQVGQEVGREVVDDESLNFMKLFFLANCSKVL